MCNRIVMCSIVRAVEQLYRPFPLGLYNGPPTSGISFEFREILESEFIPLCWIVSRPISQFYVWSQALKPQSVNEKSDSVFSIERVVCALYFDHHLDSFDV
ncbi:MAG: hypothetical protein ABSF28_13125 [Terracidiphilus sp.]|jgi:hypothetical protein